MIFYKLSDYAKKYNICYRTAWNVLKDKNPSNEELIHINDIYYQNIKEIDFFELR